SLSGNRPGGAANRAGVDPLVRARLYGGHPARLALRPLSRVAAGAVGRQAGDDGATGRRLSVVDHARHRARRQARLRAVLRAELFLGAPGRDPRSVERRHVLPWRAARRRARRLSVRQDQAHQRPVARRRRLGLDAIRAVLRPHRQFHQLGSGGAHQRRALGHGVSRRRRSAAPSEPALRGGARRRGAVHHPAHRHAPLSCTDAAGDGVRIVPRVLRNFPQPGRVRARTSRGTPNGHRHFHAGHYLFATDDRGRRMADLARAAAACARLVMMGAQRKLKGTDTPLAERLKQRIARGPISVADYIKACLADAQAGYYRTRQPIGAKGDFITEPEVSQIFGELLGLWAVAVWQAMGEPSPIVVAELGPGRGTLMADAMRAWRSVPKFL